MSICTIESCENKCRARGFCGKHYMRHLRYGDPVAGGTVRGEPLAFFKDHVDLETDDCILWPYAKDTNGYGQARIDGRVMRVHVLSCQRAHGPKPEGQEACHSCRNRHCFNSRHLRWGTHVENCTDMIVDGTLPLGEANGQCKITDADVALIRGLYENTAATQANLGDLFGVSPSLIGKIVNGKLRQQCDNVKPEETT